MIIQTIRRAAQVGLIVGWSLGVPTLAEAQHAAEALGSPAGSTSTPFARVAREARREARDRRAAAILAATPEAPVELRLSMAELLELDTRLHGASRPEPGFGGAAIGTLALGIATTVAGLAALIIGAASSLGSAVGSLSSFASGDGFTPVPDNDALAIAGGALVGAGVLTFVLSLVAGLVNRAGGRPWERRDELRRRVRPIFGLAEASPRVADRLGLGVTF